MSISISSNDWDGEKSFEIPTTCQFDVRKNFGEGLMLFVPVPVDEQGFAQVTRNGHYVLLPRDTFKFWDVLSEGSKPKGTPRSVSRGSSVELKAPVRQPSQRKIEEPIKTRPRSGSTDSNVSVGSTTSASSAPTAKYKQGIEASYIATQDLTLDGEPEEVLQRAISKLSGNDWKQEFEGLDMIRALAVHSPATLKEADLKNILLVLQKQTTNLRSANAKNALLCLQALFTYLGSTMDRHLPLFVTTVIKQSTVSNNFINQSAKDAMQAMVDGVGNTGLLLAELFQLSKDKSPTVQAEVARWIYESVHKMDVALLAKSEQSTLENIVAFTGPMLYARAEETRQYARKIADDLGKLVAMGGAGYLRDLKRSIHRRVEKSCQDRILAIFNELSPDLGSPGNEDDDGVYYGEEDSQPQPQEDGSEVSSEVGDKKKTESKPKVSRVSTPSVSVGGGSVRGRASTNSSISDSVENYLRDEDLKLEGDQSEALAKATELLRAEEQDSSKKDKETDWRVIFNALDTIRFLAIKNKDLLTPQLTVLVQPINFQLSNLRSSIVKNALICVQALFKYLGGSVMSKYLNVFVPTIVRRSSDQNTFLSDAASLTARAMLDAAASYRFLKLLVQCTKDKAAPIKQQATMYIFFCVQKLGAACFDDQQELDQLVDLLASLLYAQLEDCRSYARNTLTALADFAAKNNRVSELKSSVDRVESKHKDRLPTQVTSLFGDDSKDSKAGAAGVGSATLAKRTVSRSSGSMSSTNLLASLTSPTPSATPSSTSTNTNTSTSTSTSASISTSTSTSTSTNTSTTSTSTSTTSTSTTVLPTSEAPTSKLLRRTTLSQNSAGEEEMHFPPTEELAINGDAAEVIGGALAEIFGPGGAGGGSGGMRALFEALTTVRAACVVAPDVLRPHVDTLTRKINNILINTNTGPSAPNPNVIKNCLLVLEGLFTTFPGPQGMDKFLDYLVPTLVRRAADSNEAIAAAGSGAATAMLAACGNARLFKFLTIATADKSAARVKAVQYWANVVDKMGSELLNDPTNLQTALGLLAAFLYERGADVRELARVCLRNLASLAISTSQLPKLKKAAEKIDPKCKERFDVEVSKAEKGEESPEKVRVRAPLHAPVSTPANKGDKGGPAPASSKILKPAPSIVGGRKSATEPDNNNNANSNPQTTGKAENPREFFQSLASDDADETF